MHVCICVCVCLCECVGVILAVCFLCSSLLRQPAWAFSPRPSDDMHTLTHSYTMRFAYTHKLLWQERANSTEDKHCGSDALHHTSEETSGSTVYIIKLWIVKKAQMKKCN